MYLSNLKIENFRAFGSKADESSLDLFLHEGLNLLVGENDSGKTAIIDAIRHLLWTTSQDFHRLTEDDFHVEGDVRAAELTITATFEKLSLLQQAAFLEYLTLNGADSPTLCVSLIARRQEHGPTGKGRVNVVFRAGSDRKGPTIEGALREFLRCTYLKPLRDAEAELTAGKGSRLSQILKSHPDFASQAKSDWNVETPELPPKTLVGIMHQAEHFIKSNTVVKSVHEDINDRFLSDLSLGQQILSAAISVARSADLPQILEKLELALDSHAGANLPTRRGLGLNNVLFMATELLLLGATDGLPLLLIEEPEAHLHPQMQIRLMDMLELRASKPVPAKDDDSTKVADERERKARTDDDNLEEDKPENFGAERVQVIVTTHSPVLASRADVQALTLLTHHKAFSLASQHTKLDETDYAFLRRFLDATKANLFFARAVIIVEGDGENILMPALAEAVGRPFSKYGVSVVKVGHRGLFRYGRILQRNDERVIPIPVACVADRDVPPAASRDYVPASQKPKDGGEAPKKFADDFTAEELKAKEDKLKERDGAPVNTFVSPSWTLEHDLAEHGLASPLHRAICLARKSRSSQAIPDAAQMSDIRKAADAEISTWENGQRTPDQIAALVYRPLFQNKASKAETAQFLIDEIAREKLSPAELIERLPDYLINAIAHVTEPIAKKPAK